MLVPELYYGLISWLSRVSMEKPCISICKMEITNPLIFHGHCEGKPRNTTEAEHLHSNSDKRSSKAELRQKSRAKENECHKNTVQVRLLIAKVYRSQSKLSYQPASLSESCNISTNTCHLCQKNKDLAQFHAAQSICKLILKASPVLPTMTSAQ